MEGAREREAGRLNLRDVLWLVFVRVSTFCLRVSSQHCRQVFFPEGRYGWSYERGQRSEEDNAQSSPSLSPQVKTDLMQVKGDASNRQTSMP